MHRGRRSPRISGRASAERQSGAPVLQRLHQCVNEPRQLRYQGEAANELEAPGAVHDLLDPGVGHSQAALTALDRLDELGP